MKEIKKMVVRVSMFCAALALLIAFAAGCSLLGMQDYGGYVEIDMQPQRRETASLPPQTRPDGSAFTLAYVDIDPFPITGTVLFYIITGLRDEGWISFDYLPFDPADTDAGALIDWLAGRDIGPYIRFASDANYYTAFQSEDYIRESLTRHAAGGTVDIILTMGTSPARMVKSFELDIPVMMFGSVDPVGSGLVESVEDSGHPLHWSTFDPTAYERQLYYYHDVIPFTNLGVVYYDETIASLGAYERAAEALGVRVTRSQITRIDASTERMTEEYYENLKDVFRRLVVQNGVDAFMLTTDIILDAARTADLLEIFTENSIPVFVQVGEAPVRHGALMHVSAAEIVGHGAFSARAITQVLSGTPLSEVPQEFRNSPYLNLNLDVAERIGFRPTFEMLLASENIFTSVNQD